MPPSSTNGAGRREFALFCTIAAASFTCGVWFARAALPPPKRGSFEDSAAHADAYAEPAPGPAAYGDEGDPELVTTWSFRELRERYKALAANASANQGEVARLKQELALARARGLVGTRSALGTSNTQDCGARIDQAQLLDATPGEVGAAAGAMSATPEEVRALNQALHALHASFRDRLRALYAEATGHPADVELTARALLAEMHEERPPETADPITDVAKARTGEKSEPARAADATAYERAERMYLSLGDELERQVAASVGAERASALRAASGGWTWSRSEQLSGCDQ